MEKIVFSIIILCAAVSANFAQQKRPLPPPKSTPAKIAPKKSLTAAAPAAAISDAEWKKITDALDKENWAQAAASARLALGKLKADNDKKQLAQLRYFYIYALAGEVADKTLAYSELQRIAGNFVGKEFLMPSRTILAKCSKNLNYICPVKTDESSLRVTATNKDGSAIHFFEYVRLAEKPDFEKFSGHQAFVGGTLQKTELYAGESDVPIMRLVFERGFVNIVANR